MTAVQIIRAIHAALVSSILVLSLFLDNHDVTRSELWIKAFLVTALLLQAVFLTTRRSISDEYSSIARNVLILTSLFAVYVLVQGGFGASYPSRAFLSRYSTYIAYGFALIPVVIRPRILRRVIMAAAVCGFLESLFGIAQRFTGSWNPVRAFMKSAANNSFGLFQYENSYGAYAALLMPLVAGLLMYRMSDGWSGRSVFSLKRMASNLNAELKNGTHFILITVLVMTVALLVSGARESVLVMTVFYALATLFFIPGRMKIVLIILITTAVGCIAFLADPRFVEKLLAGFQYERLMSDVNTRVGIAGMNLQLFMERPWTGWGMGMYKYISPHYLTAGGNEFNSWLYHIHGHSSLMDLLIEAGVCGGALALAIIFVPLTGVLRAMKRDGSRFRKIMRVQSVMAISTLGLMLISDSHLRTPAISFLLTLQIGILVGSFSPYPNPDADAAFRPIFHWRSEPPRVAAIGILLILFAALLSHDLAYQARIYQTINEPMPKPRRVERLVRLEPNNPAHWELAASVYRSEALESKDKAGLAALLKRSKEAAERALELMPGYAPYARRIGEIAFLQNDAEGAIRMYQKALELSPNNIKFKVDLMLVHVYLAADTASILKHDLWTNRARTLYKELERVRGSDGKGIDSIQIRSEIRKKQYMSFVQTIREEDAIASDGAMIGVGGRT